jgi:hypothetical protein
VRWWRGKVGDEVVAIPEEVDVRRDQNDVVHDADIRGNDSSPAHHDSYLMQCRQSADIKQEVCDAKVTATHQAATAGV